MWDARWPMRGSEWAWDSRAGRDDDDETEEVDEPLSFRK